MNLPHFLQQGLLETGASLKLFDVARHFMRRQVRVLTYHSVVDIGAEIMQKYPFMYRNAISKKRFEDQMAFLAKNFNIINAASFGDFLNGARLNNRSILLTFDDGLLNNATVAAPILKQHDLPAVFFLPTAFVDAASHGTRRIHWTENLAALLETYYNSKGESWEAMREAVLPSWPPPAGASDVYLRQLLSHLKEQPHDTREQEIEAFRQRLNHSYSPELFSVDAQGHSLLDTMTWNHARSLVQAGFDIGSHTVCHPILSLVDDERAQLEMETSRQAIQQNLDVSCPLFSYPYGTADDFSRRHESMLEGAGYTAAFTQVAGFADQRAPRMRMNRLDVSPDYPLATFRYLLSGIKHRLVDPALGRG